VPAGGLSQLAETFAARMRAATTKRALQEVAVAYTGTPTIPEPEMRQLHAIYREQLAAFTSATQD
jgi:hypothetical protein